jgi:DNA-directed RNA polymerase specialized sigma24 family protein
VAFNIAAPQLNLIRYSPLSDEHVVARVKAGETALYEVLMRRYNQRLFRVVRSILRDDDEAEDVIQDAYVRAYACLHQFAAKSKFSTWLTKIALHEAYSRLKKQKRIQEIPGSSPGYQNQGIEVINLQMQVLRNRPCNRKRQAYWSRQWTRCLNFTDPYLCFGRLRI